MLGLIIKCIAGQYTVRAGENDYVCSARGRFRNSEISPTVGDRVEFDRNSILEIMPRKNLLVRPPVANVDTLIITLAVKKPNPDLMLADYLICYCRMLNIEPIICINKSDYSESDAKSLAQQYEKSGLHAYITSANDEKSVKKMRDGINEGITCFCGQSAVGKSSLTNMLLGRDMFLTGGLSKKTERGRHTTRHTELVEFGRGKYLADTPGFSLLEAPALEPDKLKELYFEFVPYEGKCRFNGCNHVNEPDCAVKAAVENGILSKERYDRYKEIFARIDEKWRRRYD